MRAHLTPPIGLTGPHPPPLGRVETGTDGDGVVFRVVGRATHLLGQQVHEFGGAMINAGFKRFEVDLSSCQHLDSTFAGVLAFLAIGLSQQGGVMTLLRTPREIKETLASLGIEALFAGARPGRNSVEVLSLQPLPLSAKSTEAWAATVLSAHQLLAETDDRNKVRLRDVLEFLMESMPGIPAELAPRPRHH